MAEVRNPAALETRAVGHAPWVRIAHWVVTLSVFTLAFSGFVILMAHPRLYWGEVGNDLTPALLELPVSRNHRHGGWANREPISQTSTSVVTANRTYDIFNQNGWGRSLHFLAAWCLVVPGVLYLLTGVVSGHFRRHVWPGAREIDARALREDLVRHLSPRFPAASGGPDYGLLQKLAYCGVIFVALPLAVMTGLAMSPTITAAFPFLSGMFGGHQSARTIHFVAFVALLMFVIVHVVMVVRSGFRRQMSGMTWRR
jgi:thiosulfate reductase cytochrome b subunit